MNAFPMRAGDVVGRPVLTLHGDAIAQVKDVIVDPGTGSVRAFTLSGRGVLSGPLEEGVPWSAVHAPGRDAVMVAGRDALREGAATASGSEDGSLLALLTAGDACHGTRLVGVGDFAAVITSDAVDDAGTAD
ncbi:PRC-barrel domain-containing protein [Streptomyces sp. NPDC058872]|uniref:PRC-barrel domain-containing protein n=1 Tax=Streptomyces sp. NPDC058872 TaxID=3346661 RepID=UPI0036B3E32F